MPEPFKNFFNEKIIRGMSVHLKKHYPEFKAKAFIQFSLNDLDSLELKQRSEQIKQGLIKYLPDDFEHSADILLNCLGPDSGDDLSSATIDEKGISGWGIMPMADYVSVKGVDHFVISMSLLKEMTKCSSSEFAIRPFIIAQPEKVIAVIDTWVNDKSQHVRRLISEGTRPRLPWGMQLPVFINDPAPVIKLLEQLKDDEKEYVRRSVANNLNDIAKDHPDLVVDIANRWMIGASEKRKKLVKHACRTLLKQGNKEALKALGFKTAFLSDVRLAINTPKVEFGNALEFSLSITSSSKTTQNLMIDYVVHHQKAHGKVSAKVFKWKTIKLASFQSNNSTKRHTIKLITTRVYYPGVHKVEIMINGELFCNGEFELVMD